MKVNISTNQQNKQSPLISYHWTQKNHAIWLWKSRSWLGTGTQMWRN